MDTLRDAIDAAIETETKTDAPAGAAASDDPPAGDPPVQTDTSTATVTSGDQAQQGDNESGDAPAGDDPAAEAEQTADPNAEVNKQPAEADGAVKAPAGWKPEVRELWSKLDPAVQAEVTRREREVSVALRSTAEARRLAQEFQRAVQPYEAMIRSENGTPMAAVNDLLRTAYTLRYAAPQQKARLVAELVNHYDIDIGMLDSALAGATPPPEAQAIQRELAPIKDFIAEQRAAQQAQQSTAQAAVQANLADFAARNEFFGDVQQEMADLIDLATRRGQTLSLQQAYDRAIMLHPTISKVVEQRKLSANVQKQNATAQRAKNASVSVTGSAPTGLNDRAAPGTLRGQLEAAWGQTESFGRV